MADFTALKTAIQTYIKQNGNEEITGEKLQEILLSVVTTLGDSAINDLITSLANEVAARQNADGTLQQNITNEATARGNADTALGGRIDDEATARANGDMALSNRLGSSITAENTAADQIGAEAEARAAADTALRGLIDGITDNIKNGYVYAGIATPSSTPATGKVFYLALTAGTYTNFGSTVVSQGINILKYNGSAWSLDAFIGIDDELTPGSNNIPKSGNVLENIIKNGSAFDLSAYNAVDGVLATYADLDAALAALNLLPAVYKQGGMSFRFVQTSDNKYVQCRLMSDSFNTTPANWQGVDDVPTAGSNNLVKSDGIYNAIWQNVGFLRGSYTIVQSGINTMAKASFKKGSYSIHIELGATETNTYFRISQGSTDLCTYFIRPGETSYGAILELSDDYDDCEIQIGSGIGNDVYFEIHEDVSLLQNTHDITKLQKSAELYNIINGFSNSDIDSSSYFLYSATRATLWIPTTNFSPYSIVKLKSLSDTWKFGLQLCKTYHNAGSSSSVYDSGWLEGSGYSDSVPLNKNMGTKVPYIAIFATDIETSSSVPTFEQFIASMKIEIVSYIDFKNTTNNALTKLNASSVDALQVGYYWSDSSRSGVLVDADNFDKYSIVEIRVKSKEAMDSYGLSLCKKKSVNTYIWSGDMTDFNSLLNVGEHYQDTAKWLCLRVAPKSGHSVLTLQEINDALDIKIYNYVDYISHQVEMINESGLYSPYKLYQYSGEKISLNCMSYESYIRYSYNIDSQKYREGCNCYGGVLFQFNVDGANVAAYDYNTKELLEVKAVSFLEGSHCNLVSWGKEKYAADDEFPLLYISNGVYSNHEVIVVRITRTSNTFTYTKVQTITITDSNEYAANVAIDIVTGKGWLMTNEKENFSIADNDFYIRSFDVPSLSSGDITIDVQDMSERITIDGEIAMQGFCPIAGKLYIPSGYHNNNSMIRVVDTMKKTVVSKISLVDIGIIVEPEQVFLYNGVLHLATASYLYKLFF